MIQSTRLSAALIVFAAMSLSACGGSDSSSGAASSATGSVAGSVTGRGTGGTTGHTTGTSVSNGLEISGTVSGVTGVSVALAGSSSTSTATDSSGSFSFATLGSGDYTVVPTRSGYVFTPVSRAAILGASSATGLTFAATASTSVTHRLSGTVTGSVAGGVVVTLNGSNVGSTVTDDSGSYSFAGLGGGTYTVTAALTGYALSTPLIVSLADADSTTNDFTAAAAVSGSLTFTAMSALPEAKTGAPYSSTVIQSIAGGTAPYHYSTGDLTVGAPPLGMILNPSGNLTGTPTVPGKYDFTVCAADAAGQQSACVPTSITVVAAVSGPAPTVGLTATPSTITAGASSVLSWTSLNATSCAASGAWSGTQAVSGTFTVTPSATSAYAVTCTGPNGSGHASVLITVQAATDPPPTVTLTASSTDVTAGTKVTLDWSSTNASSCSASGAWTGAKDTSGTAKVKVTTSSTYVLTCTNAVGSAQSTATVKVGDTTPEPTVTLGASQYNIAAGASSTLTWSTTNATACTASGGWSGTQATSGSKNVSPASSTTYTLACTGPGGSAQASASITVGTTTPPSGTSWVYYNGVFDWPGDYSYVLVPDYKDTSGSPLSGDYDIKVTLTSAYGGWLPYAQNWDFNSQGYTKLTFALKPTVANQQWHVYFVKVGDIPVGIYLNVTDYGPAPVVGQWNTYSIPLSDLGVLNQPIYKFCIQDQTGLSKNSWYIDNVGFVP